ncbi:helix-turn-helix domain-containing protein [Actinomadura mexicana]|uniref:PucR C-terminal helix-turn-helix domain-containing protein n=1 Tax=Actinomadura mexicana TaxID=134959 RepID=A0A238VQV2_9ACTN|nr:helix-turn-helix domain-containing protein [Actinomadura mexicana]SNR35869.1 PucR C-terminal helix-turn-helix domain-containing protein [Actinomadura mexicana]
MFTIGDLQRNVDLELQLMVGGNRARTAEIARAEVLQLGRLPAAEHRAVLLLTSGLPEGAGPGGAEALVAAAKTAGAVGIVHTLAADATRLPPAIVAAAGALDMPLLSAPANSSLRSIKDAVNERVARSELVLYQQLLALQSSLIAAVSTPDPTDSLLRRLGALVNSTVILYYPDGRLLAATGDGPASVIWQRIDKSSQERQQFTVGQWHVVASLINGPEEAHRWIVLARRGHPTPQEIVSQLITTVEQLLDVIALSRRAAATEEALQRADVLQRLVMNNGYEKFGWDQVRRFGFEPHGPCFVAAVALPHWSQRRLDPELHSQQLRDVTQIIRGLVSNSSSPHLVGSHEGVAVVILQCRDSRLIDEAVGVLRGREFQASAGIGRRVASLDLIGNSYRDARLALTRSLTRAADGPAVQRFEDFAVADIAISTADEDQLLRRSHDLLAKIEASEHLLETLIVYMRNDLSINDTANELNIHPNSVRYRIGRAEELIGGSLRSLPTIVDAFLAVQVIARNRAGSVFTLNEYRKGHANVALG